MKVKCECGTWLEDTCYVDNGGVCDECKANPPLKPRQHPDEVPLQRRVITMYVIQDLLEGLWIDRRKAYELSDAVSIRHDMQAKSPTKVRIVKRTEEEIE